MLTRTTITTDTTDTEYAHSLDEHLQEWIDDEIYAYVRTIIVPRIRRKFDITVTVEVS